ncbi:hypothetical protein D3C85_777390 [compost metagenome]
MLAARFRSDDGGYAVLSTDRQGPGYRCKGIGRIATQDTAYFSTGIPNIEVYIPPSSAVARSMSQLRLIMPLLRYQWVIKLLKRVVGATMKGPGQALIDNGTCHLVGEVRNAKGEVRRARMSTPNGYRLTVDGMLMAVTFLLENPEHKGFHTPTMLMGADCVERLPGVSPIAFS